jgi:hypothetical protein
MVLLVLTRMAHDHYRICGYDHFVLRISSGDMRRALLSISGKASGSALLKPKCQILDSKVVTLFRPQWLRPIAAALLIQTNSVGQVSAEEL